MKKSVKTFFHVVLYIIIFGACAAAYLGYSFNQHYNQPGPLPGDTLFSVSPGQGAQQIGRNLENSGIISSALVFSIAARLQGVSSALHAGDYEIQASMSMKSILDLLVKGQVKQYKITIPEGLTGHQIVEILNSQEYLAGTMPQMIIEGTILPDTYFFVRNEDVNAVLARMQQAMTEEINTLWMNRADNLPLRTTQDAVILASIVEKETGVAHERRRVAGLFINRLRRGMPLQSDPTVIYALTEGKVQDEGMGPLGRRLLRKDLEFDSPYNTYKYPGLPPGPIANPGIESIRAVLQPEEHNYYYMVADGTGGHAFAQSLREHNQNVAKWRQIRAQQSQQR